MKGIIKVFMVFGFLILMFCAGLGAFLLVKNNSEEEDNVTNFDECVAAGYPVMESYPRQCRTPEGENFVEEVIWEEGQNESEGSTGLANPASTYCEENGGTLEIRQEDNGDIGYCVFEDGSECEEWSYYNGECGFGRK